jgi:hypothetical protein
MLQVMSNLSVFGLGEVFEVASPVVRPSVRQLGTAVNVCRFSWPYCPRTPSQNSPLRLLVTEEMRARDSSCRHRPNGAWILFDVSLYVLFHLVCHLLHTSSDDFEGRDVVSHFYAWGLCETLSRQRRDCDALTLTLRRKRCTASPEATCVLYDQHSGGWFLSSIPRPMTYKAILSQTAFPHVLLGRRLEHF